MTEDACKHGHVKWNVQFTSGTCQLCGERINSLGEVVERPVSDEVKQIAEELRRFGLTLIRTKNTFKIMKLGDVTAQDTATWLPAPTSPGLWVSDKSPYLYRVTQDSVNRWEAGFDRWYGPIPPASGSTADEILVIGRLP